MRPVWLFSIAPLLAACSATPPAHWAQGGAPLAMPRAHWVHRWTTVDILMDGKVMVNGDHELTLDRSGRVFDPDADPIALLEPDGRVVGPDDQPLGWINDFHAAKAGEKFAWLSVMPTGEVVSYDDDGDRSSMGVWIGCNTAPRGFETCTLVTHLLALRGVLNAAPPPGFYGPPGPGVGVGVGVGIGVGVP